jgi:uncharacterized protein YjbI with pentapeptide repeats
VGFYKQTSLDSARLARARLDYANLRDATLVGADLTNAHLSCADLTDAILHYGGLHADLTGVNLYRTIMPDGQKYEDWLKDREIGKDGDNE